MQTYTMAEVKTADKTTLTAYTRAERKAFNTAETFTVTCEGCGLVAKRNRYKWVPVDKTMVKSVCVIDETTRWACANCGPSCL